MSLPCAYFNMSMRMDAAFSEFRRRFEYEARWYGRTVKAIRRYFPSTERRSGWGHVPGEMRLDLRM